MTIYKIYKDIENRTMSAEKRVNAKNDFFAFYVGRPLSYILTIPFLKTSITPNQISYLSIIPILCGFILMSITTSKLWLMIAWLMFFLWNILDGVDGNIARYKKIYSINGSVIDAMSGYASMVLTYFSVGIAASKMDSIFAISSDIYVILGGLSGICVIFPRLVMHKYINTVGKDKSSESIKNKSKFSPLKIIALNLTSITGFPQVLLFFAIIFNFLDIYTLIYFVINLVVMLASLVSLFRKENIK